MATITSYKRFFRALEHCISKGFEFELIETPMPVRRDDGKWVGAAIIRHQGKNGSSLSPIQLVNQQLVTKGQPLQWVECTILEQWGFQVKGFEIRQAVAETGYHDPELRKRILDVCGLDELDHYKRHLLFKDDHA